MKDLVDVQVNDKMDEIWVVEFDTDSAIRFKQELFRAYDENPNKPIVININSDGGSVDGLFLMLDAIDAIKSIAPESLKILTVATGRAMSAAAILLSSGDIRFSSKNTSIMVHEISSGFWGTKADLDIELKEIDRLNTRVLEILVENCNLSGGIEQARELFNRNAYLTPEKAREIGLIDIIGYPKIIERKAYELVICNPTEDCLVSEPKKKKTTKAKKGAKK